MKNRDPENLTIAVTGASGVIFARHLLKAADADPRVEVINFIASENALRVLAHIGLEQPDAYHWKG